LKYKAINSNLKCGCGEWVSKPVSLRLRESLKENNLVQVRKDRGGVDRMKFIRSIKEYTTEFFSKYPAVLSGYIIYCYLFISIMRLFYKVKYHGATLTDAYDIFSALPFMWFLAVSLVKVIEYRTKLHQNETKHLQNEKELQMKDTQLKTMHEVVKGLQHQINNPLAIIALLIGKTKKSIKDNQDAIKNVESIELAANTIARALEDFKRSELYGTDHIGSLEGKIAAIPKQELEIEKE
jgi:hypothetical protein